MKKLLLLGGLSILLFAQCKKNDTSLFEMRYLNQIFAINAGLSPFEVHYFTINGIQTNADSLFSFHKVDKANISSIQPKSAHLSALFASSDYNFIEDIEIRIFDDNPDRYDVLYFRDDLPFNTRQEIDLIPNAVDVKKYLTQKEFGIVIRLNLRDISPEFIESRLEFDFNVF